MAGIKEWINAELRTSDTNALIQKVSLAQFECDTRLRSLFHTSHANYRLINDLKNNASQAVDHFNSLSVSFNDSNVSYDSLKALVDNHSNILKNRQTVLELSSWQKFPTSFATLLAENSFSEAASLIYTSAASLDSNPDPEKTVLLENSRNTFVETISENIPRILASGTLNSKEYYLLFAKVDRKEAFMELWCEYVSKHILLEWTKASASYDHYDMRSDNGGFASILGSDFESFLSNYYDSVADLITKESTNAEILFEADSKEVLLRLLNYIFAHAEPSLKSLLSGFKPPTLDMLTKIYISSYQFSAKMKTILKPDPISLVFLFDPFISFQLDFTKLELARLTTNLVDIEEAATSPQTLTDSISKLLSPLDLSTRKCLQFTNGFAVLSLISAIDMFISQIVAKYSKLLSNFRTSPSNSGFELDQGLELAPFQLGVLVLGIISKITKKLKVIEAAVFEMNKETSAAINSDDPAVLALKGHFVNERLLEFLTSTIPIFAVSDSRISILMDQTLQFTFSALFNPISTQMKSYNTKDWLSQQSTQSSPFNIELPQFKSPNENIVKVGECILLVPQQLDLYWDDEGLKLEIERVPLLGINKNASDAESTLRQLKEVIDFSGELSSDDIQYVWITSLSNATMRLFSQSVVEIKRISRGGIKQLLLDIGYLEGIFKAVGVDLIPQLEELVGGCKEISGGSGKDTEEITSENWEKIIMSGKLAKVPVFSPSGHIYEKDEIVHFIKQNGKDPFTDQELSVDSLIEVKLGPNAVLTRPPPNASEYESVIAENLAIKQENAMLKHELAELSRECEDANHYISQLNAEVEESQQSSGQLTVTQHGTYFQPIVPPQPTVTSQSSAKRKREEKKPGEIPVFMPPRDDDVNKLPFEIRRNIRFVSKHLSKNRTKRRRNYWMVKPERFATFGTVKTMRNVPGNGIVSTDYMKTNYLMLTAGRDGTAIIYNLKNPLADENIVITYKIGNECKKMLFHMTPWFDYKERLFAAVDQKIKMLSIAGYPTKPVELWCVDDNWEGNFSIHPNGETLLTACKGWGVINVEKGTVEASRAGSHDLGDKKMGVIKPHPDGLLFATSTENLIQLWDIRESTRPTAKPIFEYKGHEGVITDINFCENGYLFASVDRGGQAYLWDFRDKSGKPLDFHADGTYAPPGTEINPHPDLPSTIIDACGKIAFDNSGKYLIVGHGAQMRTYYHTKWKIIKTFDLFFESGDISGLNWWGNNAEYVFSAGGGDEREIVIVGRPPV